MKLILPIVNEAKQLSLVIINCYIFKKKLKSYWVRNIIQFFIYLWLGDQQNNLLYQWSQVFRLADGPQTFLKVAKSPWLSSPLVTTKNGSPKPVYHLFGQVLAKDPNFTWLDNIQHSQSTISLVLMTLAVYASK